MTKKHSRLSLFYSRDRYIEELLEAQERELKNLQREPEEQQEELDKARRAYIAQSELSPEERLAFIKGAVAAGLLIAGVFILAMFLFLLFCTKVWFV